MNNNAMSLSSYLNSFGWFCRECFLNFQHNRNVFRSVLFAFFSLILTACQTLPKVEQLPPQAVESRSFKVEQQSPLKQVSVLTVQFEPQQWRWVQTDPLGAPLARLILTPNGWQNDGFIAPNRQAQWLFSAIAVQLNPNNPPFAVEKFGTAYRLNGKILWYVEPQVTGFRLTLADQSQWRVELLE